MDSRTSSLVAVFDKVLRAFETGGFAYADVLAELNRVLAAGASPTELLDVLRRRAANQPLPEYARVQLVGVLHEAIAQTPTATLTATEQAGILTDAVETAAALATTASDSSQSHHPSVDLPLLTANLHAAEERIARQRTAYEELSRSCDLAKEAESAASARAAALAVELASARAALETQTGKTREIDKARAESLASTEALRLRGEVALREAERHQTEARTLRDSVAARDAAIAQLRRSLSERDAQFTALQQEHVNLAPALEARVKSGTRLESDLQAARARAAVLAADLEAARAALESEQGKTRKIDKALAESMASTEAERSHNEASLREVQRRQTELRALRDSVAARDATIAQARQLLDERDAQVAALGQERAKIAAELEARAKTDTAAPLQTAQAVPQQTEPPASITATDSPRAAHSAQRSAAGQDGLRKPAAHARVIAFAAALVVLAIAWRFAVHTPAPQAAARPAVTVASPGTLIRDCPTCPSMTVLPVGRFKQGTASVDSDSSSFEKPLHWVAISQPFAMSRTAVTVEEFRQFVTATGRDMQGCDIYDGEWQHRSQNSWTDPGFTQTATHPVTCVSWNDAAAYAQWLSTKTGHRYRLPSASEWEYAARAGGEALQPWGADGSGACGSANVADASAARQYPGWTVFACDDGYANTAPVASFKGNSFGLNDMLGNVFQWTADCWHADYNGAPVNGSARMDGDCSEHELRGGSWFSTPTYVRANYRNHFAVDYRTSSVGIRLARDIAQ